MTLKARKIIICSLLFCLLFIQNLFLFGSYFLINNKTNNPKTALINDWEVKFIDEQTNGRDIAEDENQNIYIVGNTFNFSKSVYDVLLCKYNSSNNLIWNVSWGGIFDDYAYALYINQTSSNIYVVGRTVSYGKNNSSDISLLSYNYSGALQWNITWGGNSWDVGYDVICASNFIYVTGYSNSFSLSEDIVVLKYNSSGSLQWNKTYGTVETDIGYGITLDNANNIFITGKTTLSGNIDLFLMKLDSNGNQLWNTTWGGSNSEEGRSILINPTNEIFILANTRSFGMGSTDLALLKLNSTGGLKWYKTWGGTDIDTGYKLINDSNFNLFLIGYTESYGLVGKDACIIKYNSTGGYQWYKTRGDRSVDIAYSGYIDINDNLFITGKADDQLFLTKFNPYPSRFDLAHNATNPDIDGTFTLSWSESLDAKNYTLYQSNSAISEVNSSTNKIIEGNTNRTVTFNNLGESIYYYIAVAHNDFGNTTSNLINITVQYLPGEFFLYHDAEFPDKDGTVNFNWTLSQGAENYDLYINDSLYQDNITKNSFLIENLVTGDYSIVVFAINEAGQLQSNEALISIKRIPSSFSLSTDANSPDIDGTFELLWTKSRNSVYYIIYNSTTFIAEINSTSFIMLNFTPSLDLPIFRYNLSGLNNGTYFYKIFAFNHYGNHSTDCIEVEVVIPPILLIQHKPEAGYVFPYGILVYIGSFAFLGILIIVYKKLKKSDSRWSNKVQV